MLCIILVVAYPYDRLLEPPRASIRNYNHFHWQKANLQANKSFPVKHTFNFFCQLHTQRAKNKINIIKTNFKICHLSPWHKSESKDWSNGWLGCCKLVILYFVSSHRAYINIFCPLRHKGRQAAHTDIPACWSHHHQSGCRHSAKLSVPHLFM